MRSLNVGVWIAGLALAVTLVPNAVAQIGGRSFTYASIDVPGATNTIAEGINDFGEVVGYYIGSTTDTNHHGFTLLDKHFRTINFPGAALGTDAFGVNSLGWIVGDYFVDDPSHGHGYVLKNGVFAAINFPGAVETAALGINATGEIVGMYIDSSQKQHGFLLHATHFTSIDFPGATSTVSHSINLAGEIAGFYFDPGGRSHGFVLSHGNFLTVDFPGAVQDDISGISSDETVGGYVDSNGNSNGYLLQRGVFHVIAFPAASSSHPNGVNDSSTIVGNYVDSQFAQHGFYAHPR